MATEKLQIILDAAWRGKSSVQGANKDINKLDDSVGTAKVGFGMMAIAATAAFAAVGVAAKLAWDELGKGAALLQSREQFDNLTRSINSTADVMLGRLREATNGMVSDANLIAGAGQIISLGLADTEDSVVRLATLVGKLGWDMQQVIMTFANNSVMRLDALGLSVEDVTTKAKALEVQGYSTDKAFDMAVIEAGEAKVELLGDASLTTAGDIQRLQTAWENARDSFSLGFAEGAVEEVGILADNVNLATESIERFGAAFGGAAGWFAIQQFGVQIATEGLDLALKRGVISQEEYNDKLGQFINDGLTAQEVLTYLTAETDDWLAAIDRSVRGLGGQATAASAADIILRNYASAADDAAAAVDNLNDALAGGLALRSTRAYVQSMGEYGTATPLDSLYTTTRMEAMRPGAAVTIEQEMGLIARASDEAKDALADAADTTDDLTRGIGRVGVAAESAAEKMARLAAETGKFFDQARRSDEFDPAEAFYSAALAAGASAAQLQQLLVTTGLETPERAQEIYNESIQRQLAAQAGGAVPGGENIDMLWQGIQAGMANPQWAQQVTQDISNVTDVGGVKIHIEIHGNITGEELEMIVDNQYAEAAQRYGDAGGT